MSRILFLSSVYPRAYEPTRGTYCFQMCRDLATDNVVRVISPRPWLEAMTRSDPGAAPELAAVGQTDYPWYFYPPRVLQSRLGWFMWASIRRFVRRAIEQFRPDCVLSYWAHPDGEAAVRAARLAGVPVGIVVGGSDVLLLPRDPKRGRAVANALRGATAVFAVGQDLQNRIRALGVAPEKVHVVRRGVDERFTPGDRIEARKRLGLPQDGTMLLWVGQMVPVKGLEILMQACGLLAGRGVDFRLTLIGDGPARRTVTQAVTQFGLQDRVRTVGFVRHEMLPDWFRAADLTVLSSHSEGIPNVLRESLACGTPYVATRVGGVAELSDDPAVRLTPPANPAALAEAIEQSLSDRRQLSSAASIGTCRDYARTVLRILLSGSNANAPEGNERVAQSPGDQQ